MVRCIMAQVHTNHTNFLSMQASKSAQADAGEECPERESDLALQCLRLQGELQTAIQNEQ